MAVNLTDHLVNVNSKLEFVTGDGDFGVASARQRQTIAGEDAAVELDGVTVTTSSNTFKDLIAGSPLLAKEDAATNVNLTIGRDLTAIKNNINDFVAKYNEVMSYINTQFSYNPKKENGRGPLWGRDPFLRQSRSHGAPHPDRLGGKHPVFHLEPDRHHYGQQPATVHERFGVDGIFANQFQRREGLLFGPGDHLQH